MDEIKAKGICLNCNNKYSKRNKCNENKLFYIDCEEEKPKEEKASQEEATLEEIEEDTLEEITHTIYGHALDGISTLQTIKIEGYIKKKKVTMLIDSGSTHNFIHCKLAKVHNCFVYPAPKVSSDDCRWRNCQFLMEMPQYQSNYGGICTE